MVRADRHPPLRPGPRPPRPPLRDRLALVRPLRRRHPPRRGRDHRRLQPGLLHRRHHPRRPRRRGDAARPLVLQPQDVARHERHRDHPPPLRRRHAPRPATPPAPASPPAPAPSSSSPPTTRPAPNTRPTLIAEFAALAREHGAALILDETYRDFHASAAARTTSSPTPTGATPSSTSTPSPRPSASPATAPAP